MTNEQKEGTRIIAEFMKWEEVGNRHWIPNSYPLPENTGCTLLEIGCCSFHTSFDWLMPVWVKVKYIGADLGRVFEKYHNAFHVSIDYGDAERAFNAVVKFLTWLKQKQAITEIMNDDAKDGI